MFILTAINSVARLAIGFGAGKIAKNIVQAATPEVTNKALKVGYKVVGGLMIGGLTKVAVNQYNGIIKDTTEMVKNIKKISDKNKKKIEENKEQVAVEATKTEA